MKILFDQNVPRSFAQSFPPHEVLSARPLGWDRLSSADLFEAARNAGFDVLLTTDRWIEPVRDTNWPPLPVIALASDSNARSALERLLRVVRELLRWPLVRRVHVIRSDQTVVIFGGPPTLDG